MDTGWEVVNFYSRPFKTHTHEIRRLRIGAKDPKHRAINTPYPAAVRKFSKTLDCSDNDCVLNTIGPDYSNGFELNLECLSINVLLTNNDLRDARLSIGAHAPTAVATVAAVAAAKWKLITLKNYFAHYRPRARVRARTIIINILSLKYLTSDYTARNVISIINSLWR